MSEVEGDRMMASASLRNGLIVVLLTLGLAACGNARPFDYQPEADEMKPGAGLFSGKKGEFVIFGGSESPAEDRALPKN